MIDGFIKITVKDAKTGGALQIIENKNVFVTTGREQLAKLLSGESTAGATHCAMGSSATAPAAGDTALGSETCRVGLTSYTRVGTVVTLNYYFGPGDCNGGNMAEAGLLTATSGGALIAHGTFTPFAKDDTKAVSLDYEIKIG